jgi:hypothetical protein
LEMAYIKMEAVLQVPNRWQITDTPLLQWQSKLKRAAEECDNTLLRCKQRTLEEEQMRKQVSQSSFPKRIAHATKSFLSSFIGIVTMSPAVPVLMSGDLRGMQMVQMNS